MIPREGPVYEIPDLPYEDPILDMVAPDTNVQEAGGSPEANECPHYSQPPVDELSHASPYRVSQGYAVQPARYSQPPIYGLSHASAYMYGPQCYGARPATLPELPVRRPGAASIRDEYRGEDARGVKYVRDLGKRRRKYEVTIGAKMLRRMDIFDTARIKALYFHKLGKNVGADLLTSAEKAGPVKVKDRAQVGMAHLGSDPASKQISQEWAKRSLIWVCAPEDGQTRPSFYSHIGKIQKFHHSSLKAGEDVICAGEWIVEKGRLLKISANSGHYRPTIDHLHSAVLHMAGAWHPDTVVLMWNIPKLTWEDVPVLRFKENPGGNGTYKVHPES